MDPPTSRRSSSPRRNADRERELQRLKSRGVVSVLNKTFESDDPNRALLTRSPSPTTALRQPRSSSSIRSTSWHQESKDDEQCEKRAMTTPPPVPRLHRKKSSCSSSSTSPATSDDDIEHYRQMLQQTQQALALCQLELQQQQQPVKALCEVIRKQDQLIHTLTNQPSPPPPPPPPQKQQHEETWQALRHELDRLKVDRHTYEAQIRALRRDLESSQNETRQLATLARLLMAEATAHQDDTHPPTLTPSETTTTTATVSIDDDNAYREFTQQLHTRLSLSDDITLTLYDYAALDKAAAAADKRTSTNSQDTTTHFWKGMKKRLATIKTAGPVS
ncbi:hypothetical protein [Absidia glauca]|uniref:Uncharacterized protein n=1 Tax=Absidia glauca TaxID=4829 RepID=A0A168QDS4_ABSGL|nr:hypothetical protein [Absidia glauca]